MIGLDGADGEVLDRYSADGTLPNLAALRSRGAAKRISSLPGLTDDALWASFQYAADVADHGRYHFYHAGPDGSLRKAYWDEQEHLTFWDKLSAAGMRIAVLDVPKCRNPRPINGIHLADWLVHGRYFPRPRSQPHSLAGEVIATFGDAPSSRCGYWQHLLSDAELSEVTSNLKQGTRMKRKAGMHYLASQDWDLFLICFKAAHCANHAFLDFEPSHPDHDPGRRARMGDPILSALLDIDQAIGDLVAAAGPDSEVVVFSPSDFQPNGTVAHFLPEIVERVNARLAVAADQPAVSLDHGGQQSIGSSTRCQVLPYNENCAALRIFCGHASPAAPAVQPDPMTLDAVEAMLRTLRERETGRTVIAEITRPSTELKGSRAHCLPDLLIHWASGLFPDGLESSALGRFEGTSPAMRPGNHSAGGITITAGTHLARLTDGVRSLADLGSLPEAVLA